MYDYGFVQKERIRGTTYNKLEELYPGPIDDTFDEKSLSQTHAAKAKNVEVGDYLTTMPSRRAK